MNYPTVWPTMRMILGLVLTAAPAAAQQPYRGIDLCTLQDALWVPPEPSAAFFGLYSVPGQVVGGLGQLWDVPNSVPISLGPASGIEIGTAVLATDGAQQVGYQFGFTLAPPHHIWAVLWSGTEASAVNLNPVHLSGSASSEAIGIGGGRQVGWASFTVGVSSGFDQPTTKHAILWAGSADSAIDLNPSDLPFSSSVALATDGADQVGEGQVESVTGAIHALVWHGTAESAVDLHPTNLTGFGSSSAKAVSGNQQVGEGIYVGGDSYENPHALLWYGTAESAVDLHPAFLGSDGFSHASGTNGRQEVGYGHTASPEDIGTLERALLWNGTAESALNLQLFLPDEFSMGFGSKADTVDARGNVFGEAIDDFGQIHAVEWVPVPEPKSLLLLLTGILPMCSRRRTLLGAVNSYVRETCRKWTDAPAASASPSSPQSRQIAGDLPRCKRARDRMSPLKALSDSSADKCSRRRRGQFFACSSVNQPSRYADTAATEFYFDASATAPAASHYVFPSSANYFDEALVDSLRRHRIALADFDFTGVNVVAGTNDRVATVVFNTAPTFRGQLSVFVDAPLLLPDTPNSTPTPVSDFVAIQTAIAAAPPFVLTAIPEPPTGMLLVGLIATITASARIQSVLPDVFSIECGGLAVQAWLSRVTKRGQFGLGSVRDAGAIRENCSRSRRPGNARRGRA